MSQRPQIWCRQRLGMVVLLGVVLCTLLAASTRDAASRVAARVVPGRVYLPLVAEDTPLAFEGSWGTPIAISPRDGTIWVVNPDAGSVSVIAPDRLVKIGEVALGGEPWALTIAPDGGTVYVVDRATGLLEVVDTATLTVRATLPIGQELGAIALSPSGRRAYVTVSATDTVAVIDTTNLAIVARIAVAPQPFGIAVSDDGDGSDDDEQIYVTHLLALPRAGGVEATDDGKQGMLSVIALATQQVTTSVALAPDAQGFPNLLSGIALARGYAWVPHVRAAPDLPNGLTTTVFAAVAAVDRASASEDLPARLSLNDQDVFGSPVNDPVAVAPAPDGRTLYVVLAGSDLVEVIDISDLAQPRLRGFVAAGRNPRGLAISADGRFGFVMSYLSRAVTVIDLEQLAVVATVQVTGETLPQDVLRGKILFHTAVEPRMARLGWVSCASCHLDGGSDGVTWMFPDGPRQTPALWNAAQTRPWHWSAALDEAQDVEDTIQRIQQGIGLLPGRDPPLLGAPLAGRSSDLDALAAFLDRGIRAPKVSQSAVNLEDGRRLFVRAGCASCHGGPHWTTSALPGAPGTLDADGDGMVSALLHDVGTYNERDVRGASGFDVPSLLAIGLTAPYLHDGSLPTLEAVLESGHPLPRAAGNGLNASEIAVLAAFLRSIDLQTALIERP